MYWYDNALGSIALRTLTSCSTSSTVEPIALNRKTVDLNAKFSDLGGSHDGERRFCWFFFDILTSCEGSTVKTQRGVPNFQCTIRLRPDGNPSNKCG